MTGLLEMLNLTSLGREVVEAERRKKDEQIRHLALEEKAAHERFAALDAKLLPSELTAAAAVDAIAPRYAAAMDALLEARHERQSRLHSHEHLIARIRRARRDLADHRIRDLREQLDELANNLSNVNLTRDEVVARVQALRNGRSRCDELIETYMPATLETELAAIRAAVVATGVEL